MGPARPLRATRDMPSLAVVRPSFERLAQLAGFRCTCDDVSRQEAPLRPSPRYRTGFDAPAALGCLLWQCQSYHDIMMPCCSQPSLEGLCTAQTRGVRAPCCHRPSQHKFRVCALSVLRPSYARVRLGFELMLVIQNAIHVVDAQRWLSLRRALAVPASCVAGRWARIEAMFAQLEDKWGLALPNK